MLVYQRVVALIKDPGWRCCNKINHHGPQPFIVSRTRNLGTFQGWDAGPGGNIDKDVFHLIIIWEARGSSNRLHIFCWEYDGIWIPHDTPQFRTAPSIHHQIASHSSIGRGAGPLWLKHSGKAFRAWQLSGDVHWDFHPAKLAETCHKTAKPSRNKAIVRLLYVSAHIVVETGKSRILWASRFAYSIAIRCFLASKTSCENKTNYDKLKL